MDNNEIKLQKVYTNLYNEIVQPDRVCVITQYFRTQWMPRLNPRLAWLIVNLRQHCYWNKQTGELRDWCIVDQTELSRELGADKKTLRRLMKSEHADKFILEARTDRYRYDGSLGKQVRQKTRYRIRMDDPLTPEDEVFFKERLEQEMQGLSIDPETGQMDWLKLFNRPLSEIDPAPKGQNTPKVTEQKKTNKIDQPDKIPPRSNGDKNNLEDKTPLRTDSATNHQQGTLSLRSNEGPINQTGKTPLRSAERVNSVEHYQEGKMPSSSSTKEAKCPQYDKEDKMSPILYKGQNAPILNSTNKYINNTKINTTVVDLLTRFAITEPALSKYQNLPFEQVEGWITYADTHDLSPGFVVKQLALDAWPPRESEAPPDLDVVTPAVVLPEAPPEPNSDNLAAMGLSYDDLAAWRITLERLQGQMTKETYDTWVQGCRLDSQTDGVYTIAAPDAHAVTWLEKRLSPLIERTFRQELTQDDVTLRFVAEESEP
ncbi:MAG: hypothetical protein AAF629_27520 [Chloroflexota bacterium]